MFYNREEHIPSLFLHKNLDQQKSEYWEQLDDQICGYFFYFFARIPIISIFLSCFWISGVIWMKLAAPVVGELS